MVSSAASSGIAPALARCALVSWTAIAGCGGEPADLTTEQLSKVVTAQQPTLERCYDAELERQPTARELRIDAVIHIEPSGRVSSVGLDPGASPPLQACLRDAIKRWQFPRAAAPTETSLPLIFRPQVVPSGPHSDEVHELLKQQLKLKPAQPAQTPAPAPPP